MLGFRAGTFRGRKKRAVTRTLPLDRLGPAVVLRGFCSHCCFRCHGDHGGNTLHPVQVHPVCCLGRFLQTALLALTP